MAISGRAHGKRKLRFLLPLILGKEEWFLSKVEPRQFAASGRGVVEGAVNVWDVLCSIVKTKPARVNIFTHGTDGNIVLSSLAINGTTYSTP